MGFRTVFRTVVLGIRSLLMHKLRSFLTMLGILFGVSSVIAMLAIGEGQSQEEWIDSMHLSLRPMPSAALVGGALWCLWLYLFFFDAWQRLESEGRVYVVVISGLRQFIKRAFLEVFGNHTKVKQGRTYTVAMAEKRN